MKRIIPIISLALGLLWGCQTTPPPAPGLATLRVTVTAEPKAGVVTGNTHVLSYDTPAAPRAPTGAFEKVDYTGLPDIVVWLEQSQMPATSFSQLPAVAVDVKPRQSADALSAAVSVGQQVIFRNTAAVSANLYSVSDGNDFDLGTLSPGGSAAYTVKSPGLIEVLSDATENPVALLYAAPSTNVRLTHAGQTVDFADLAPGQYKIVSWHPRLPGQRVSVTLAPNQITSASIKVGVNDLPKIEGQ